MSPEVVAIIVSIISLIFAIIAAIWNYIHTNNLFLQANYPKILTKLELSGGNFSGVRMDVLNTHPNNSVSDVHIYLRISGRKRWFSLFPSSFTVEAMPIESISPRSNARTLIKDNTGNAMLNLNDMLIDMFPDMLLLSRDKTMQMRKVDGSPGKEVSVNDEYYKVINARRLHIEIIVIYKPDIYKGKRKRDTYQYIITPGFDPVDKYKAFIKWNIQQIQIL